MSQEHVGAFVAAMKIEEESDRDAALAKCAENAAKAGQGKVADLATSSIARDSIRLSYRYKCAIILAAAGQTLEATTIAERMEDESARQEVLKKIARNEFE